MGWRLGADGMGRDSGMRTFLEGLLGVHNLIVVFLLLLVFLAVVAATLLFTLLLAAAVLGGLGLGVVSVLTFLLRVSPLAMEPSSGLTRCGPSTVEEKGSRC